MTDAATKPNSKTNPMPESAPLLQSIQLQNFLSFGPNAQTIDLGPLNILIGPNGSGKSNVIEAISLMRSCPVPTSSRGDSSLVSVVKRGGGVEEWIWKGDPTTPARITTVFERFDGEEPLHHGIEFATERQRFHLTGEFVARDTADSEPSETNFFYGYTKDGHFINVAKENQPRQLTEETIEANVSILAQRNDPEQYPEISYLTRQYGKVAIYREWAFGRNTILRRAQSVLDRSDWLEEDFSNLFLFLNQLSQNPKTKRLLLERLRDIYEEVTDISFEIISQFVRFSLVENDYRIPCERLSDGTLRYLCLLAILCDPTPPPLICIEEPELGLHPDILPKIADLLVAASERTQLIVTTHSDIIVDSLTDQPESVFVVEKHDGQTTVKHPPALAPGERLGTAWIEGRIGGTRW